MLKTIALIGLTAAIAATPASAFAQTGYGVSNSAPSTSTFDRAWNHANQSKQQARASAAYIRHHAGLGWYHHHHHYY
jgi:hypothetical protein